MTKILKTKRPKPEKVIAQENMKYGDTFIILDVEYKSNKVAIDQDKTSYTKYPTKVWRIKKYNNKKHLNQNPDGFITQDVDAGEELETVFIFEN